MSDPAEHCWPSGDQRQPVLLLLHGLGAHGGVWAPFADAVRDSWPGIIVAPDLPGHGSALWTGRYGIGSQAAEVAKAIPSTARLVIVAHSMGGLVALALATGWFGIAVDRVLGIGIKVNWTEAELDNAAAQAAKPVRWFDSREDAAERFLKVSGLAGLACVDEISERGVVADDRRWRLAADPATSSVGAPDMAHILAALTCPVRLASGTSDRLASIESLRRYDAKAVELSGGHNVHVERPVAVAQLLAEFLGPR